MIRITDKYVILVDDLNYTVAIDRHKVSVDKETGKERPVYTPIAYVSGLDAAIETIARKITTDVLKTDEEISLEEALSVINDIYKAFIETIKEAIPEDLRKHKEA